MEPVAPLTSPFVPWRPGWREILLGLGAAAVLLILVWLPPVSRGPGFHNYADERSWLGIPYAGDVLSNLPFVLVGLAGLQVVPLLAPRSRVVAALMSGAFVGVGFGSGLYHMHRTDLTLVLDWLPIVLVLSWLTALVISDRIGVRAGRAAAWLLPAAAVATVMVWWLGGGTTGGDMRWYVGLQLSLVVITPAVALMYPAGLLGTRELLLAVACFLAARTVNLYDHALLDAIGISGHSLKHLFAALASWCVIRSIRRAAVPRSDA